MAQQLAPDVIHVLALLPVWGLAAFLAYARLRHAWRVADLRGHPLVVAGCAGAWPGNLAVTAAVALVAIHAHALIHRGRARPGTLCG